MATWAGLVVSTLGLLLENLFIFTVILLRCDDFDVCNAFEGFIERHDARRLVAVVIADEYFHVADSKVSPRPK